MFNSGTALPLSHTHTASGGRTIKRRLLGFVCYLYRNFLQCENFPVVLLHTSHTHFSHSLILFLIWSQSYWQQAFCSLYWQTFFFHFSSTDSPVLSQCHLFHNCFLSTKHLPLPICFPHQIHALSLDWEASGAGTVSRLTCMYVYLPSKSPSSKPQSPITVTNACVDEKTLTC